MEVEKIVYKDRFVEIEKIKEIPMITERIVTVKQIVEVPIEIIKIQEVIKEVERIVYQNGGGGGGADSDCDCLTSERLLGIWNGLFKLSGPTSTECLTEE